MTTTAKVFSNGASQAVRLPKEFRFDAKEVCVKRIGSAVLLFPRAGAWDLMAGALGQVDADFARPSQPRQADRRRSIGPASKPADAKGANKVTRRGRKP